VRYCEHRKERGRKREGGTLEEKRRPFVTIPRLWKCPELESNIKKNKEEGVTS
jgi:hypothetical protein